MLHPSASPAPSVLHVALAHASVSPCQGAVTAPHSSTSPGAVSPSPVSEPTAGECRCGLWPGQWGCGCSWAAELCQARDAVCLGQGTAGAEHMGGEAAVKKLLAAVRYCSCHSPGQGTPRLSPPQPQCSPGCQGSAGVSSQSAGWELLCLAFSEIRDSQNPAPKSLSALPWC